MGGGGSKAASVHKGVARAAAAAPKPPLGAAAAAEEAGISAAERQREAELLRRRQEVAAQPQEQRQDNEQLVTAMNRAMAGMRQYQYQLYRNPEVDKEYAVPKLSKEEKEKDREGRLAAPVLKQLLEEHAASVEAGRPLSAAALARKYGARQDALEELLKFASVPIIEPGPDGSLAGRWPGKKPRQEGSQEGGGDSGGHGKEGDQP